MEAYSWKKKAKNSKEKWFADVHKNRCVETEKELRLRSSENIDISSKEVAPTQLSSMNTETNY